MLSQYVKGERKMDTKFKCPICKSEYVGDSCPNGCKVTVKKKKPLYKKWWFWVIIVIVVIAVAGSSGGNDSDTEQSENKTVSTNSGTDENTVTNDDKTNDVQGNTNVFSGDCGITASAEVGKSIIGLPELTIAITNVSDKDIAAIRFYSVPYDVYGDEIKGWTTQKELSTDTTIPSGESNTLTYQFIEDSVKSVKLYVYSVYFTDGTEWGDKDATKSEILKYASLINVDFE